MKSLSLLLLALAAYAQVPTSSSCLAGVTPGIPTFSISDTVGVVADYTLFCTNTGFSGVPVVGLNFDYFTNVPELNTGSWTLTQGSNTFIGAFIPGNHVSFTGVLYDRNQPTLSFELHGVEVDPSAWPPNFVYHETMGISGTIPVVISNDPDQVVGLNGDAPEPSTLSLAAIAGCALWMRRRRVVAP